MLLAATVALIVAGGDAFAARVNGILVGYNTSAPLASRDLHFSNEVTNENYLSPTHSDGSFAVMLPPGTYSLRTETGAVLKRPVVVKRAPVNLGQVSELAPYAFARLWQRHAIAPSILTSPAPSTAFVMTVDTTSLPPSAETVPKPEIDWTKLPASTQASAGPNAATAEPETKPVEPRMGAMGGAAMTQPLPATNQPGVNAASPAAPPAGGPIQPQMAPGSQ
jgi:hypothetical protein